MPVPISRFVLRLPRALHLRLKDSARAAGCSLNQYCVDLLDRRAGPTIPGPSLLDGAAIAAAFGEPLEGLVLFGSAARRTAWDSSDVDLLVVLPAGSAVTRAEYDRWDGMPPRGEGQWMAIAPSIVSCPQSPDQAGGIWFEAALDGIVIWDPRLRVSWFLAQLRREIATGRVVRGEVGGQSYWYRPGTAA